MTTPDYKMKNLKLVYFNLAFMFMGGGDKRFIEIAKRLIKEKHQVIVITSRSGYLNSQREGLRADFRIVPFAISDRLGIVISYLLRSLLSFLLIPKFRKNLIAYSTSHYLPDVIPALLTKWFNRNSRWVVAIYHIFPHPVKRRGSRIKNIITYYGQKLSFSLIRYWADKILAGNPLVEKELIQNGFAKEKVVVVSCGVDLKLIKNISEPEKIEYEGCFLGRLHPVKGIFDLIKIWRLVVGKLGEARLAIIGSGTKEIREQLFHLIQNNGLERNIEILDRLTSQEAVYEKMKASKIFLFPSHEEGWGIAICEAMACRLPVVAWDLPVYEEVFPQGIARIKEGDIKGFSTGVLKLLNDTQFYTQMSNQALEIASRYDWNRIAQQEWEYLKEQPK